MLVRINYISTKTWELVTDKARVFVDMKLIQECYLLIPFLYIQSCHIKPYLGTCTRVPEVIQGRGGESHERGIEGAGGESWAAGANRAKKAFCHVLLL